MGKSLYLGTYAGIPVYVHWTFGFILLFIVYAAVSENMVLSTIFWFVAYVISLFLCVILHEFGHALAAKKFGIKTRDIIISPIGGLARMESMPSKPWKELIIAIAGPMVNVVIAVLLGTFFFFMFNESFISAEDFNLETQDFQSYLRLTIVLNIALFVFNLIPAFPMDGGRILRALLAMKWGQSKATLIASYIGRFIAIVFFGIGIWYTQWSLTFIGLFIYFMATSENQQTQIQSKLKDTMASTVMERNYTIVFEEDLIEKVIGFYKNGMAKNYLVFNQTKHIVGSIPELFILNWMQEETSLKDIVGSRMSDKTVFFEEQESLLTIFEKMNKEGIAIVGIKNGDQLTGVIDRHSINSFLNSLR